MQCIDGQSDLFPTLSDFDPPLKRKEADVPGYWTIEELALELGVTPRNVRYLIKGDPKRKNQTKFLKAYNAGKTLLIADKDALLHLWEMRQAKKS